MDINERKQDRSFTEIGINAERTEGKRDLNIILTNPFSEKIETEYLGFWVTTHDDVKPTNTK